MDERRQVTLDDEAVAEAIRRRKARTKFGVMFVLIGGGVFCVTAWAVLFRDPEHRPDSIMATFLLAASFGMAAVGGGYVDGKELKGFIGK